MRQLFKNEQDRWNLAYTAVFLVLVILLILYVASQGKLINQVSVFDFSVLALATFRLVRLFVSDTVTGSIRRYLGEFATGPRKTASDLLGCPWCTGMWMTLVVLIIYLVIPYSWIFLLLLAMAALGSIIQVLIDKL